VQGSPRALTIVLARNLLLAVVAFHATRLLTQAPLMMDSAPVVPTR